MNPQILFIMHIPPPVHGAADKVWIGNGCMIQKGAHVPNNCVIGARSVVAGSNFDDHTIIVGNTARSVKKIGGYKI